MKTTAYRCDRCGADCTSDPARNHLAIKAGPLTRGTEPEGIDLCGPCTSDLTDWLQEPGKHHCSDPTEPVQS